MIESITLLLVALKLLGLGFFAAIPWVVVILPLLTKWLLIGVSYAVAFAYVGAGMAWRFVRRRVMP